MKAFFTLMTVAGLLAGCSQKSEAPGAPSGSATGEKTTSEQSKIVPKLAAALAQAKKENKHVFLDFTGSDWCGPCMQMDEAIFAKPRFLDFAAAHLVTVKVDFPKKEKLPEAEQEMNDALQEQFKVEGFPTLVILTPEGKEVWRADDAPPNLGALLAELEGAVEKK